jgi:hypothetical protein
MKHLASKAGLLLFFFFDAEDGGDMFHRSID